MINIDIMETTRQNGPKGEPGPFAAENELGLVSHIICELEKTVNDGEYIAQDDGHNHQRMADGWTLIQTLDVLRNYEALLCQPLYELIPPFFYHTGRIRNGPNGVR